ncbi:Glycolike cofC transferase, GTA type superfamily [Croceitalea dokdonensis DOKDO 023]|uniref:Glycolike cofC transferase, GTA type superfamily n=1 Tax=Croceitalea dokdonensis DOKDO 023 TaxID=1300341 RepID=A0A0P7AQF9_9FLAO|nr:DUF2064 domain-containing protein [Croceitalea dokdonensis]KPM30975.1 Glycolike cofC transferase, GTA type superfamily [Croceitalea dokdonensis DOKDO 023]
MHHHKTAILVFANSSSLDQGRKNIPNSGKLFEALNQDILDKVKKTSLPYFHYNETLQIGGDFGTRFTAAIQSIFAKGYDSIITVGNDTPNLTTATILKAFKEVQEGRTVIGPSTDGGVYILGFHKNRFESFGFRELPWQQQDLFQEIARFFLRRGMLHQLPRLTDIDGLSDIKTVLNTGQRLSSALLFILIRLVRSKQNSIQHHPHFKEGQFHSAPDNKGSPLFF